MARDNGRTDEYAPDSTLESCEPSRYVRVASGKFEKVSTNDFVDLSDAIPPDPIWGSSFQVVDFTETQIVVRLYNPVLDLYELAPVDTALLNQNYQLSPFIDEADLPPGAIVL